MSSSIQVICDLHFEGDRLPTEVFHDHASTLMEELYKLDECNDRIADAVVSSDAGKAVMTVEMFVAAGDPFEASELALGIIRTALHAAGAYTGGWPISHLANETRDASELIDA